MGTTFGVGRGGIRVCSGWTLIAGAAAHGHSGGMSQNPPSAAATEQPHPPPPGGAGQPDEGRRQEDRGPGGFEASGADGSFDRLRRIDLRRSPDGWIGGVCAGIGHRVGLDPLVIRAGAVLLGIFFGLGVLLYLLAWFLIPDGEQQTHAEQGLRRGKGSSIFLLVLTSLVLLTSMPWWVGSLFGFDGGFGLVGLLVTALLAWGLWTVWQGRGAPGAVSSGAATYAAPAGGYAAAPPPGAGGYAAPPPPPPSGNEYAASTGGSAGTGATAYAPPPPPPRAGAGGSYPGGAYGGPPPPPGGRPPGPAPLPPTPPKPRRLRRRSGGAALALIAAGLLLVIVAGLGAGPALDLPGNDVTIALAAAAVVLGLLVLGLGLTGRRAGFVGFLTVLTMLAALLTAPLPDQVRWEGRAGDVVWIPETVADLKDYELGAGDARLDLRSLDPGDLTGQSVEVSLGAGVLTIVIPDDLTVQVESEIGVGELMVREGGPAPGERDSGRFGRDELSTGGLGIDEGRFFGEDAQPHLVIRADVGLGQITIEQE